MSSKEDTDRLVIRMLRLAVNGLWVLCMVFVGYLVATFMVSTHDNRRLDAVEKRVEQLEHHHPEVAPGPEQAVP